MKGSNFFVRVAVLSLVSFGFLGSTVFARARRCDPVPTPSPVISGGLAFASFGNGAFFSWNTYVPPTVHISQNGTSTSIATTAGYFNTGTVAGVSKFKFTKDLYTSNGMNKISPDVSELQKVLVAEGLLGVNSATGIYDDATRVAVDKFQHKYGIKPASKYPYGYFGPLTRAFQNSR